MWKKVKKYKKAFSAAKLFRKIPKYLKSLGVQTIYSVLLLYNAYTRKETPTWAKNIILGTLGYLLSPIDSIPDITPFVGFTDDLGVLSFGLVTIACYINNEIKVKSKDQLGKWLPNVNEEELAPIDAKL